MKILVTGAGGFIGSHLVEQLVENGYDVRAFIRYNSSSDMGCLKYLKCENSLDIYYGDIRDFDSVKKSMDKIDVVFHLAALIGIPYSYVSPLAYIKTNVEGTYNILQSSLEANVSHVIHTSTSEIYGTAQYIPMDEVHPINPQSPYAATKSSADQLALSYYRSFDLPVSIIRPFNTFGPRQSCRAVIPNIITQLNNGGNIKLGNVNCKRDMNFVLNTCDGFIKIGLNKNSIGEIVNIGYGEEYSIIEIAKKISLIMDKKINIETDEIRLRPIKSEVERLLCNIDKAKHRYGWLPKYKLDQGLRLTIEWYINNKIKNGYCL